MEKKKRKTKVFKWAVVMLLAALTAGCKQNVSTPIAVSGVTLNQGTLELTVGTTEKLTATVSPANATNKAVTWSSDKPAVASVDATGKVTAEAVGEAVITVTTADGNKTASCKITVKAKAPPAYAVTFNVDGGNGTLKAKADGITETEASSITVKQGETVIFTAAPDSGYVVEKWTVTPADALQSGGTDGSTTATVKITADTTVNVTFKLKGGTSPASADKTYTVDGVSFTMKGIAAVTGGSVGHTSESDNKPHTVSLTAYRIGETEVTQELWQAVMGHNPSYFTSDAADGEIQGKRPVETVTWFDCIAFCNELTKKVAELGEAECVYYLKENDTTVYTKEHAQARKEPVQKLEKKGFRLPTEAEWEWAAKGGTENKWAGTDTESELKNYAWYSSNSDRKTHEVKKKTRNGYGLHDMSGNVWEWCWDWYGSLPDPVPADYTGADSGSYRVHRGGSWYNDAVEAARAFRINFNPSVRDLTLGLRVVSCP